MRVTVGFRKLDFEGPVGVSQTVKRKAVPAEAQEQRQEGGSGTSTFQTKEMFGVAESKGQRQLAFVF